ncbi:MAG TPA: hypothetical protein VFG25_07955 [Nitrosopumilaceae archaeon]|nr:hypothetical protein [Nitrosopumilaceae archaeon]
MPEKITKEDRERVKLLSIISSSKKAFKELSLEQLERLRDLVEKKDYSHNKKAHKSKVKLLSKINVRIFELEDEKKYSKTD